MKDRKDTTDPAPMRELSAEELATVSGGRRWCYRNGRWYPCGPGNRPR